MLMLMDMYVALWSLINLSTSIVPESKTGQALESITGSINVAKFTVILVGLLRRYLKLEIDKTILHLAIS